MSLNETPSADRVHISFFGVRNAGKSSLVNALTGQEISVVSSAEGRGRSYFCSLVISDREGGQEITAVHISENGETERADTAALLRELDRKHRGIYARIVGAMERAGSDGCHV